MSNDESSNTNREVFSTDGKSFFKVIQHSEKSFSLEKYIVCYDEEEEVEYTIRQTPDPASLYGTVEIASNEAKRILGCE